MKWYHSRNCSDPNEPRCVCGHPLCLHRKTLYPGKQMGLTGPCRSRDCDGQCEGWEIDRPRDGV